MKLSLSQRQLYIVFPSEYDNLFVLSSGYVDTMKELLFTMTSTEWKHILNNYSEKEPKPLNTQFPPRNNKNDAVKNYCLNKERMKTPLCQSGLILFN